MNNKIVILILCLMQLLFASQNTQEWSGTYSFSENIDSQNVDLSKSRQQIFRFLDCEDSCLVEYEALHKYSTCEILKDDGLLHLKVISKNQAILSLKFRDENNAEKVCEVALKKTQSGFKAENPLLAIESCNINLSIFESCGAGTNPDWTMEFVKESDDF